MSVRRVTIITTHRVAVKQDRRVNSKAVPCPICQVGIRESCITAAGTPTGNHPRRRVMALRAEYGKMA